MPAQLTTRAQVNGYRFLLRRLDHALVRRDVRMLHDPMRSQMRSFLVSAILGLLVVAGAAILAFIRPQGSIGNANIVMGKDSGALYVVVKDSSGTQVLHPVLNLASARLIAGSSESPTAVKDSMLRSLPRGPILGIPGGPAALPGSVQGARSDWTLCDAVQLSSTGSALSSSGVITTVLSGRPVLGERVRAFDRSSAILVQRNDKTYLIYDGKRAEVDTQNQVIARSLNLALQSARSISPGLLDAAPEAQKLTPPEIPHAGEPGPGRLSTVPVGAVIRAAVNGSDNSYLYVVLAEGVQRISPFTAQVIRNTNSQGMSDILPMAPDVVSLVPVVTKLPVDQFPYDIPKILAAEDQPYTCLSWAKAQGTGPVTDGPADRASLIMLAGTQLPLADSARPVDLATADGTGDRVDAVYVPPSSGEFVQVTGIRAGSPRRESLFYVADNGTRYGIPDLDTADKLGLGKNPKLAPWEIIGQLVPGPALSRWDALVQRDSLSTR
ncbi:type VII secretion protein EccB [Nocardia sp. CA-107356]|uniref:type VII secretion protein EccB n=1 Tax=Nocardia sp. CA-107356 TaxID=3239972 RepID=UPI003D8F713F